MTDPDAVAVVDDEDVASTVRDPLRAGEAVRIVMRLQRRSVEESKKIV
jgi:hypothetical protein